MRFVRNLLYFVIGVLFSTWAVFSHAETIPATLQNVSAYVIGSTTSTVSFADACNKFVAANGFTFFEINVYPTYAQCRFLQNGSLNAQNVTVSTTQAYECPTGQNWTLSGQTCSRPDCVSPQVRNATTGVCESPCSAKKDQYSSGYVKVPQNSAPPSGNFCLEGCQVNRVLSVMDEVLLSKGYDWYSIGQTYTGESCAASNPAANPTESVAPSKPAKTPPCASGEGVMTSSSGSVKCVPEGIPDAPKPVVKKEKKVETYPDNTTKTTETTTTTDPNTNATHTSTSSTASAKPDGTSGQAGAAGTTTTTGGTSTGDGRGGNGSGDGDGDCDPKEKMCSKPSTDDLYEKKDKTIGGVLGKFSTDMKATPIGKAVEESLNIEVPSSGACPDLSANIPYLNTTIDLAPYICSPTAIEYLEVMGTVLKIMVGYIAFTWVFL